MSQRPLVSHPVLITLLLEGALGLVATAVGWRFEGLPWRLIDWNLAAVSWGLLATLPPLGLLLVSALLPVGPLARLTRMVRRLVQELFAGCNWVHLALVALAAGFGEELLFRGVLQPWASEYLGPLGALIAVSLLFGLAHAASRTYAVVAAVIGLYLGWLWLASDNLLVPIVTHAAYDFVALVYLLRPTPDDFPDFSNP